MKYICIILFALFTFSVGHKKLLDKATSDNASQALFSESESKLFASYAKMINCATKPLEKTCPDCVANKGGFKLFFFHQTSRLLRYQYKFMIHYNDREKKVLISMAGPSVKQYPRYVQVIYTTGFRWVSTLKVQVEREYQKVYYSRLRSILLQKIKRIKKSGRANYQFIFTGHSIGASLATLASYDLTRSKVLTKSVNKTKVFSYGGLRIGDQRFVTLVNSSVSLYRIIRNDDFVVRVPNCYYSITANGWRCFTQEIINKYVVVPSSPLFTYLQNYRYSFYYSVPVYSSVRTFVAWRKKNAAITRRQSKSPERNSLKVRYTHQNSLLRKRDYRPTHVHQRQQLLSQNRFRRSFGGRSRRNGRFNKFSILSRGRSSNQRFALKQRPFAFNSHKNLRESLRVLKPKPTVTRQTPVNQQQTPAKNSQKFVQNNKPSVVNLPKLQLTPTAASTYYYQYVYYTQPFGMLYYYPGSFGSYTYCSYVNFVSECERRIVLPNSFSIAPHLLYYGINFETC